MSEKLKIHTTKMTSNGIIADYYVTFIRDPANNMVMDTGDTPEESEANAKAYLEKLKASKNRCQEEKQEMNRASHPIEFAR